MDKETLHSLLDFIQQAEPLKHTLRSAYTSTGRHESTAEHTWRLALLVMLFADHMPELDSGKLLRLALVHDLGEVISGDIPAVEQVNNEDKNIQERQDFLTLIASLPEAQQNNLLELWDEYDQAATPEAKLVKALDKLETIVQHNQGKNPKDFDYAFNLHYGKKYTDDLAETKALRELVDGITQERIKQNLTDESCTP